jgi:hypothetical protein
MKLIMITGLLFLSWGGYGQTPNDHETRPLTSKYAGTYSYGKDIETGRVGTVVVYPETDSTLLFYIELNRGAPSYNMGSLYGRVKMKQNSGVFYTKFEFSETGCKWAFQFSKTSLAIKTVDGMDECGFGFGVLADGAFKKLSDVIPEYFKDMEPRKIFFRDTSPEDYNKE